MIARQCLHRSIVFVTAFVLTCAGVCAAAQGSTLYPKGQRAMLEYSIAIEGDFEHRSGYRDEFYKWSTRRQLEATVEMQAGETRKVSRAFPQDAQGAAAPQAPGDDMRDLQKQMEACPKNDTNCQMQLAMKMMNTGYMKQQMQSSEAIQKMPMRYQAWQAVQKGSLAVKAAFDDHWEQVYYTAGREFGDCHLSMPATLSDLGRAYVEQAARFFSIEVDTQTGRQRAFIPYTGDFPGQRSCIAGMGSNTANAQESRQDEYVHFFPKMDVSAGIDGTPPGTDDNIISSGERTVDGTVEYLSGNTPQRSAPVRVTVRWKLTRQ